VGNHVNRFCHRASFGLQSLEAFDTQPKNRHVVSAYRTQHAFGERLSSEGHCSGAERRFR
jgi:hypothetical protein